MSRFLRLLATYSLVVLVASCSGSSCSSCAGGAIHPIHGEYPLTPEQRIPHAMQIRLTDQGLQNVSTFAPDLLAGFLANGISVPRTTTSFTVGNAIICPDNNCRLTVTLPTTPPAMVLSFVPTNEINAKMRIIIQGNIPVQSCIAFCDNNCNGTVLGGGCISGPSPTINIDTTRGNYAYIGLETDVALRRDSHAPRRDYFCPDFVAPTTSSTAVIQETPGETIEDADLECDNSWVCAVFSLLESTITSAFTSQFGAALAPIQAALASSSMPDPPGCPAGTAPTSGDPSHCYYSDNRIVPTLLGTQGTGNFGALLSSFTPGLVANASYDIAAGDHANDAEAPNTTGMTINVFGAMTSDHHSSCVPQLPHPAMPTIPEWTNLRQNMIPGSQVTTDLGIGVAEDFMNSAMWNLWDSGLFCLGLNSRTSQVLSTNTFSVLPPLATLKLVTFPATNAALAITLRPQNPPTVHVGAGTATDPLMLISFHGLALDFYAFSEERYIRFMTATTDLSLPVSLMTDSGGLHPTIGTATTANTVVTNSQILSASTSNAVSIAAALGPILGTAIGMFAGSLPTIAIPLIPLPATGGTSAGNIQIQIPQNGIQGLAEGASRYLALFANLSYVSATGHISPPALLETSMTFDPPAYDPQVFTFGPGFTPDQLPRVTVHLASPNSAGHDVEYTYRVDGMTWSPWTRESTVSVAAPSFIAQGSHHIEARARVVDQPESVDTTPARVDFDFDTNPPNARVERPDEHTLNVVAEDDLVDHSQLQYSYAFDNGAQSSFDTEPSIAVPNGARHYDVFVRDTNGNTTHLSGELVPLIIRGGPSTDTSSCGCSTPGGRTDGAGSLLAAMSAALMALSMLRRRRSNLVAVQATARAKAQRPVLPPRIILWAFVVLSWAGFGCQCGQRATSDGGTLDGGTLDGSTPRSDSGTGDSTPSCIASQRYCAAQHECVAATPSCNTMSCQAGYSPSATPTFNSNTCAWDCDCMANPPLPQGMAGSFLDMAVGASNTLWFSSYSAGDPRASLPYGDLVVGTWDHTNNVVDWTIVDGVPSTGTVTGDPNGWRHGIRDPGDDDGRWNSIALDSAGHPHVAYWDATHDQLKFASFDGTNWTVSVVDTAGHNGRYASLIMLPNDIPAIAYRATLPDTIMAGHVRAHVRFAKANNATPHLATDWTIGDIATAATSCRAIDCTTRQVCVQTTGVCTFPSPSGTCATACSATQACIMGACENIYTSTWVEDYPPGIGLFNSLALDTNQRPAIVYYDRDRGNLMGAGMTSATAWSAPFIIDGETPSGADIGDRGMWSSLVITPDDKWHIGYVDAYNEAVLYTTVMSGQAQAQPEIVDDGSGVGTMPFSDGHHIIGDSVDLAVDSLGTVRIVYQDSTEGTLRLATRGTAGWTASVLDMTNSTGYWARISGSNIATFWRNPPMDQFGVRVFPVP